MSRAGHALGIDVGGSKIAGGLVDLRCGRVTARRELPTLKAQGGEAVLDEVLAMARALLEDAAAAGIAVRGLGLGLPELVDREGNVGSSYNFPWAGLPLRARFASLAPTVVESDVRAAARGEARFGASAGCGSSVYVNVGSGISYCLCLEGVPYAGAHGYAIHFASSPLAFRCSACGNIERPVLEELASGPALVARYNAATGRAATDARTVLAACRDGVSAAVDIVTDATTALGAAIGLVVNMLDPEVVVIGGGLGCAGGPYGAPLTDAIRAHIWAADCRDLPIRRARLGADAGIVGAAAAAAL